MEATVRNLMISYLRYLKIKSRTLKSIVKHEYLLKEYEIINKLERGR